MSTTKDKLKSVNAKRQELAVEQKALREKLNEGKEERKVATKAKSESRTSFNKHKSDLRKRLASSYLVLKDCDSEEIGEYADEIIEIATVMAEAARECSTAVKTLDSL